MIWRLVGYNEAGDEVSAIDLSADVIARNGIVIVCPPEAGMRSDAVARLQSLLADTKNQAFVRDIPIQVWKVEILE